MEYWIQMIPKGQEYKVYTRELKMEDAKVFAYEIEACDELQANIKAWITYPDMEFHDNKLRDIFNDWERHLNIVFNK